MYTKNVLNVQNKYVLGIVRSLHGCYVTSMHSCRWCYFQRPWWSDRYFALFLTYCEILVENFRIICVLVRHLPPRQLHSGIRKLDSWIPELWRSVVCMIYFDNLIAQRLVSDRQTNRQRASCAKNTHLLHHRGWDAHRTAELRNTFHRWWCRTSRRRPITYLQTDDHSALSAVTLERSTAVLHHAATHTCLGITYRVRQKQHHFVWWPISSKHLNRFARFFCTLKHCVVLNASVKYVVPPGDKFNNSVFTGKIKHGHCIRMPTLNK